MFRKLPSCAVPGYAPICLDSNDPATVTDSIYQRLLRDLPDPDTGKLERFKGFVQNFLEQNLSQVRPYSFEEWLERSPYDQNRKAQLRQFHHELRGGVPTRDQRERISSFIKTESYPTWKQARTINSRSDYFKVYSGPYFKAIEDAVYQLPEFIKHTPVPERPAKIATLRKANMRYYATDYTSFESHFVREFMDICECALYRHCISDPVARTVICETIMGENSLKYRSGVKAKCVARRMSGDMCTSLGNGFTNLMLTKFVVAEKHGTLSGFVEGDDGIFATDVELSAADYSSLGWTIKIEEVEDPCSASFCGMIFSSSGQIIRDPRRFVQTFAWTHSFVNAGPRIMNELLRAKALSTCFETPHCPIVGAMARRALADTVGYAARFVEDGYHKVPKDVQKVTEFCPSGDTRVLFEQLYGISPETQLDIEYEISTGNWDKVAELMPAPQEMADYAQRYLTVT
jgi:hypothetical protein